MKRYLFIAYIITLCPALHAQHSSDASDRQTPGTEIINRRTLEAHLSFLASDALEGREAGRRGGRVAAEYIRAMLTEYGLRPFYNEYFQFFEAYSPTREKGVAFQVHPDSVARYKRLPAYRRLNLQNVVGWIEGERKEEYILIGAHYDHLGVDDLLVDDPVYNGADDNASGVAALLQVAKAFAQSGKKPLRSIIFGFWDGEEINYLGSEYFAGNFGDIRAIKANINLDMISREGLMPVLYPQFKIPEATKENTATGKEFHLLYTEALTKAGQQTLQQIRKHRLDIIPKPALMDHRSVGSDYMAFATRDIPVLWFFTGLHPDYHTPNDEIKHIDLDKLTEITQAIYLILNYITK